MKTPLGLFAGALLLWGWQTGLLGVAVALALALEAPRLIRQRWEFTQVDFDRIWNLCAGLFFGLVAYLLASEENGLGLGSASGMNTAMAQALTRGSHTGMLFFQWLPLVLMPIILAQAWGSSERLAYSTFSWFLRRRLRAAPAIPGQGVEGGLNISWPALGVVIAGASAGAKQDYFLTLLLALAAWALWWQGSQRVSRWAWLAAFGLAASVAFATQAGLHPLRAWLQQIENELLNRGGGNGFDARESRTRLGHIGTLKTSGRIVVRMEVPDGDRPPELLREASYDTFKAITWQNAINEAFQPLANEGSASTWIVRAAREPGRTAKIWAQVPGGRGLLPVPLGSMRLTQLPAVTVETNALGTLRAEAPALVGFDVQYNSSSAADSPPRPQDLEVPEVERAGLAAAARAIGLPGHPTDEDIVRRVSGFFSKRFNYSLTQASVGTRNSNQTVLGDFLTTSRRGHCEHFASAGTLLLRQAGIPARYAVGWSVQERKGGQYVIRARHAHAWTLAYVNGAWREVDFTPGSWAAADRDRRSIFEPVLDVWWRFVFEFNRVRYSENNVRSWLLLPAGIALVLAIAQIFWKRSWRTGRTHARKANARIWPGHDSDFYAVEARLRKMGFERRQGETLPGWMRRVRSAVPASPTSPPAMDPILHLHHRLRFDPAGLNAGDAEELRRRCREWLAQAHARRKGAICH